MAGTSAETLPRSQVLVFGDQSTIFLPSLQSLLLKKGSPFLVSFVERVGAALRKEIANLPATDRRAFPAFASVQELVTQVQRGNAGGPVLESTLSTFHQLCSFIQ